LIYTETRYRRRSIDDTLIFFDGQNIHQAFRRCSIANLKAICQQYISTSAIETRSGMYALISQAPSHIQDEVRQNVICLIQEGFETYSRAMTSTMESCQQQSTASTSQGVDEHEDANYNTPVLDCIDDMLCQNAFMTAPSRQAIDSAIAEFIDRTSNAALAVGVCAVCARETFMTELSSHLLEHIPNPHHLKPIVPHPRHDLLDGMLLHPTGLTSDGRGNICAECCRALKSDRVPMFSLANGLWVGQIPHELAYLTLPERILIAKYFPAAYIIKLYPKKKGARHWDKRQMYSGLRGNVSTYRLDQTSIASMIDGSVMPQAASILAATIGITFVGPKNLPEKCLPNIFRVRRIRVQTALEWLKLNNPLFENITISASRLAQLPEDGVPYELTATAKLSTDINMLHAEQDGYVPSQEANDGEGDEGIASADM
jgi:hypothetical protein